ncbi:hypothetical protein HanXRQr2_Chr11g0515071 [Helianthus annuus]|uniref:Uncharacterized protein n=1 Tax=Helianthus annuus TaxID=4232 RepID=A0A9K3HTR5_HELAN|nr:hypothetical protein HanXRQr2_Chr11g0515071 [Helianthus annuus]KAJ0433726.1 hypothetical protein HanIR_Chr17g0873491 [Helianthus annuus]KAJ0847458.1 hypothetical protein HanPSC8_Chr13g0545561 [Helianthus annuus]
MKTRTKEIGGGGYGGPYEGGDRRCDRRLNDDDDEMKTMTGKCGGRLRLVLMWWI